MCATMRTEPFRSRKIAVVALAAAAAFVWFAWPTVRTVGQAALLYPDYSHCVLVPFLAGFLAWTRKKELQQEVGGLRWPGIPAAAAGMLLSLLGWWYEIALHPGSLGYVFLLGVGIVLVFSGGLWSFLGTNRLRVLAVPVAFLLFAVPLPDSLIESLTAPLRTIATVGATFLLQKGGLAAHREGNVIELANGSVGVDDACSGIRSVWVLLTFAAFIYALTGMSKSRATLLLLAVPVMAIAANLVRVGLSAWAVARGQPRLAEGTTHDFLGMVTAAAAAVGIVLFGLILSRSRGRRRPLNLSQDSSGRHGGRPSSVEDIQSSMYSGGSGLLLCEVSEGCLRCEARAVPTVLPGVMQEAPLQPGGSSRAAGPLAAPPRPLAGIAPLAVCALLILGSLARARVENHYRQYGQTEPIPVARRSLAALPEAMGTGRQVTLLDLRPNEIEMLKPDDRLVLACSDPSGITIHLRVLYWKPELVRPSAGPKVVLRPHNPDICYPGAGWISDSMVEHEREFPWSNGEKVSVRIFRKLDLELLTFFWLELGPSEMRLFVPAELKGRIKTLIRSWSVPPAAYRPARYAVVASGETGGDSRRTREVLEAFCRDLVPLLPAYGIGKGADGRSGE